MGQSVMQFAAFECAANFMVAYLAFVFLLSSGSSAFDDSILDSPSVVCKPSNVFEDIVEAQY